MRLDIWHFMRRLARGCTSESHPLYATFMSQLSGCIFEWDASDYDLLMSAKKGELIQVGLSRPSPTVVRKAVTKEELVRHCRRRTRGAKSTTKLIESLLLSLSLATRCSLAEGRDEGHLAGAEKVCAMPARSTQCAAGHCHWEHH